VALDMHGNWKLTVTHRFAGKDLDVALAIDIPTGRSSSPYFKGGEHVSLSGMRPSQRLAGERL
jgi:hypothetical protein